MREKQYNKQLIIGSSQHTERIGYITKDNDEKDTNDCRLDVGCLRSFSL